MGSWQGAPGAGRGGGLGATSVSATAMLERPALYAGPHVATDTAPQGQKIFQPAL